MWKWIQRIILTLAVLMLLLRGADWWVRRQKPFPPLPQPNGYEELLVAATAVKTGSNRITEISSEERRALADENRPAVMRARASLATPSRVPVQTKRGWMDSHLPEVQRLKKLAVAFGLEAGALLEQGRTNAASDLHLDLIRLSQVVARGGVVFDGLNALALETIGVAQLQSMVPSLDTTNSLRLVTVLEQLDATRETAEAILQTEKRWARASFGLIDRFAGFMLTRSLQKGRANFLKRYEISRQRTRRLILRLATHAYELEHGRKPNQPAELIPKYLKSNSVLPDQNPPADAE